MAALHKMELEILLEGLEFPTTDFKKAEAAIETCSDQKRVDILAFHSGIQIDVIDVYEQVKFEGGRFTLYDNAGIKIASYSPEELNAHDVMIKAIMRKQYEECMRKLYQVGDKLMNTNQFIQKVKEMDTSALETLAKAGEEARKDLVVVWNFYHTGGMARENGQGYAEVQSQLEEVYTTGSLPCWLDALEGYLSDKYHWELVDNPENLIPRMIKDAKEKYATFRTFMLTGNDNNKSINLLTRTCYSGALNKVSKPIKQPCIGQTLLN